MKKIIYAVAYSSITLFLASCGGGTENHENSTTIAEGNVSVTENAPEAAVPKMAVNASEWAATDLHSISPMIFVSVNLPKEAKMEKNGNGGVDIAISDFYTITVSNIAVSTIKDAMERDKSLTINNASSYINGKVISEDANGFIYSIQSKDEENGTQYKPEVHFAYYVEKEGVIYSILDQRPMSNFFVDGSAYTEDIAKTVYDIVKTSAKAN